MNEQLELAQSLFTAAINYNLCLHSAFVSQDDFVTATLVIKGKEQEVQIPTYHSLLNRIQQLSTSVNQLQINDEGNDVIQLLSTANNVKLLYLQKRQYYLKPPKEAEILKIDYETQPTIFSSADKTAIHFDLAKCFIPADAQLVIAKFDDQPEKFLPIKTTSTAFDNKATIIDILDNGMLLVDSNDFTVDYLVQVNSAVYKVAEIDGNTIRLVLEDVSAARPLQAGDIIYSISNQRTVLVEVPVAAVYEKLQLAVQYQQMRSEWAAFDVQEILANGLHQTLQVPLTTIFKGTYTNDTISMANLASKYLPTSIAEIAAASKVTINDVTYLQTNTHQYINSELETLLQTNATLEQANADIRRLEGLITTRITELNNAGLALESDTSLNDLYAQLESAKSRYDDARTAISQLSVAIQNADPEYITTLHCNAIDSTELPVVQYVARYQRLSYNVKDLTQNWQYAYGNRRTVNPDGTRQHPIDQYSTVDGIAVPIKAYEQLAVQVAAVLQYGQPFVEVFSDWSDVKYCRLPDALLKEVTIEQMFQNAYGAQLYSNVQQALRAAGVLRHIDPTMQAAHTAQVIQYDNIDSVYSKIAKLTDTVAQLTGQATDAANLSLFVRFNNQMYPVVNGGSVDLMCPQTYYEQCNLLANNPDDFGAIAETGFEIVVVNNGQTTAFLHTMQTGSQTSNVTIAQFGDIPIYFDDAGIALQRQTQNHYRSKNNAANNRQLVSDGSEPNFDQTANSGTTEDVAMPNFADIAQPQMSAILLTSPARMSDRQFDGIAFHSGFSYQRQVFANGTMLDASLQTVTDVAIASASQVTDVIDYLSKIVPRGAAGGQSILAKDYIQSCYKPGNSGWLFGKMSRFFPGMKYTSGRYSRGAAMFFEAAGITDFMLPVRGASNAIGIEPGIANAYTIQGKFQSRFTDRIGMTDATPANVQLTQPTLQPTDAPLPYKKAVNVNIQLGTIPISFDIIVQQRFK